MEGPAQSVACPDCHAMTDDLAAHGHSHSRLVHDLAVAIAQENDRRETSSRRP